MKPKTIPLKGSVSPNPNNPRRITHDALQRLMKSLKQFGDLSGVILNQRTGQLVGGHQRVDSFQNDPDAKTTITETFTKPTSDGTVAVGYITAFGLRYSYRVVDWDSDTENAANIAANQHGGEFDDAKLHEIVQSLIDSGNIDREILGFDEEELQKLLKVDAAPSEFDGVDENIATQHKCPKCGYKWSGKPS